MSSTSRIAMASIRSPDRSPAPSRCARICSVVPVSTTSPKCSTEMWSATSNTTSMSCSISRIARFGIEPHQELRHLGGLARRQAGRRLVQQQDLRIAREAEHDLELALLAVRKIADLDVLAVRGSRPASSS